MKKQNLITFLGAILILLSACRDDSLAPILTFDQAEKGAYVRVITQNNGNVNLLDIENSVMEYSVEFVDLEQGKLVSEYNLQLVYEDNNSQNGDDSAGPIEFRSWSSGDFITNKDGFQSLENVKITATEAINAVGINAENILSGDKFRFQGNLTTVDGKSFNQTNSSASVNGNSFRGFFNFNLDAFCPSNLEGTYNYKTTAASVACSKETNVSEDLTGDVTIIALGNGVYNMSDWSFGAYTACYGAGKVADAGSLQFTDICSEVDFTGKTDDFGDKWTFTSSVSGNDWTITWENTFDEKGSAVLTNDAGWNFTIIK